MHTPPDDFPKFITHDVRIGVVDKNATENNSNYII